MKTTSASCRIFSSHLWKSKFSEAMERITLDGVIETICIPPRSSSPHILHRRRGEDLSLPTKKTVWRTWPLLVLWLLVFNSHQVLSKDKNLSAASMWQSWKRSLHWVELHLGKGEEIVLQRLALSMGAGQPGLSKKKKKRAGVGVRTYIEDSRRGGVLLEA